jgi:hypothetical protein
MALMPVLLMYHSPRGGSDCFWLVLAVFTTARLAQLGDAPLFARTGLVSGHTLKHVLAAAGGALLLCALHYRRTR